MSDQFEDLNGSFWGKRLMWTLVAMIVIIILIAALALRSPISQPVGERTMLSTHDELPAESDLTEHPKPVVVILEPEDFLDPEEIGHTGGIIFWSTILILIAVGAILRETILRKK